MFEKYVIINRKPKIIMKIFVYNILVLMVLSVYLSREISYTSYYSIYSYIFYSNNEYYLKLIVPIDKINLIIEQNMLNIEDNAYNYEVNEIDSNVINNNSQVIYLKVYKLDSSYKINNYMVKVKFKEKTKKLIDYFKV